MRVTVCGPNLRDQSKGTFHVHKAGCRDLAMHANREPEYHHGWTIDEESRICVVDAMYEDILGENGSYASEYLYDFWFAPCCADLPVGEDMVVHTGMSDCVCGCID